MATAPPPPARRRNLTWPLAAVALVLLVAVVALLVVVVARPAPASTAATPTPTPSATPAATPTPGSSGEPSTPASQVQQHQQYRAYVSTVVQGSTAVVADLLGLAGCRNGREECEQRLSQASAQVTALQRDLAATPAPACLTTADQRLQDSLTFQQKGLDIARGAMQSENRVRLAQGLLLTAAGVWRAGQAIVEGRQADC